MHDALGQKSGRKSIRRWYGPILSHSSASPTSRGISGVRREGLGIGLEIAPDRCRSLYNGDHLSGERLSGALVPNLSDFEDRSDAQVCLVAILVLTILVLTSCHSLTNSASDAKISFTQVPQWDLGDLNRSDVIEGKVSGSHQGQQIVLYSKTGDLWWLQPRLNSPTTPILPDGVWRNEVHLATDYAALLVNSTYHPIPVLAELPKPGHGVDTVAASRGQEQSSSFFVNFSGFQWRVRKVPSDRGGAVNPYDPRNVYVDKEGALRLQILNRNNQWTCSEVSLTRSLGYGTYSFTVEDTSHLEPAVMFGMFTWDFSTDQENHREFDINISRWGDSAYQNAEFVVQPASEAINMSRFEAPAGRLKHTIIWEAGRVTMMTFRLLAESRSVLVSKHVFASQVPTAGSESVRMTFFVYSDPNRKLSRIHDRAEVVVDHFEFLP